MGKTLFASIVVAAILTCAAADDDSLYGAYGPYGGAAYWNRYTYQQGRLW
jgi:hypothetical protein